MAIEKLLGTNGVEMIDIKRAVIATSAENNTIVAAVTSKKIRVLSLFITAVAAMTVRFESATGGTALTGAMTMAAGTPLVLPYNPLGWFETVAGELLNLETATSNDCDGALQYIEV
jgi:hypothetical protein